MIHDHFHYLSDQVKSWVFWAVGFFFTSGTWFYQKFQLNMIEGVDMSNIFTGNFIIDFIHGIGLGVAGGIGALIIRGFTILGMFCLAFLRRKVKKWIK